MAMLGSPLYEWQESVLEASMGERSDGRWAARQIGLSTPRQNGKSQLVVARALAGVLLFDEQLILCSAHQQDTAREVFNRLVDILEENPSLDARVDSYGKALNREYIRFKGGQTIRFKARSTGGGRGFSADCLLLDEAQILGTAAWSAILPTMSARPNPQVWLMGTPPTPQDDGDVFGRFRDAGLEAKDNRIAYLEWAAEPTDDLDDPAVWAKANPLYGIRIDHEAIEGERSTMTDDQFAMERLGIWAGAQGRSVIDASTWATCKDEASIPTERFALAVDVSPDRATASVALAGQREDGDWHIELDETRHGTGWLVAYIAKRCERNDIRAVVIDGVSPAASIVDELKQRRIRVTVSNTSDMRAACGTFYDGVMEGWLHHIDQPQLNLALSVARKRPLLDAWAWNRKTSTSDITPLVACTLALWGAQSSKVKKPKSQRSSRREAVVL